MAYIEKQTELKELDLWVTKITPPGLLAKMTGLRELKVVNFTLSNISDEDLKFFKSVNTIRSLNLNWTEISDASLRHVGQLQKLETLYLQGTPITDRGLIQLNKLHELQSLFLTANQNHGPGFI